MLDVDYTDPEIRKLTEARRTVRKAVRLEDQLRLVRRVVELEIRALAPWQMRPDLHRRLGRLIKAMGKVQQIREDAEMTLDW
jgi:hypothetical protein